MSYDKIYGMYRGVVVYNTNYTDEGEEKETDSTTPLQTDAQLKGRCKIFVYGVYPEKFLGDNEYKQLPWAEPAYPIFGGNHDGVGINSVPKVGASVWVFFEQGDYMKPVYSFGCQGGDGWVAEHVKQHVIKTESVEIVIDENKDQGSKGSVLHIGVNNPDDEAVVIDIQGNVNLVINGDVVQEITGDVQETVTGNVTRDIEGNFSDTVSGTYDVTATGIMTLKASKIDLNP